MMMVNIFWSLQSLQLLSGDLLSAELLSNWLVLVVVGWPRFPPLCLLKTHLPRHAYPPKNSPSNQPCIQIALKSGPPQIGVELRPNLVLKSGQKGAKKAICGDPELPCEHECVHVLSSFFPSIGALAPRDRDGVTSEAKYRFNMFGSFFAHTCMQPLCHRPSTKMAHFLATKKQPNEKRQIIRKWKRGGEGDFSEVPIGVLDFGDRNSCP